MSIRLLEHLRDELIQTGIVTNTPEFCRSWLGRSEGYIRVLRYNRIDPSLWRQLLERTASITRLRQYVRRWLQWHRSGLRGFMLLVVALLLLLLFLF
jgi:hypothetical protein